MGKGTPLLHDAKPLKQRLLCCEASYEIFFWPWDEQVILTRERHCNAFQQ